MQEKYFNINGSGVSIRAKMYYNDIKKLKRAVIFCHGFSGCKDNKAAERLAKRLLTKHGDMALFAFDLPCHGDDVKKTLALADCSLYVKTVIGYVQSKYRPRAIFGNGTSFGGYLLLKHIIENGDPFEKIALRCPAIPMYDVLSKVIMSEADSKALAHNKPVEVGFDRKIKVTSKLLDELRANDIRSRDYTPFADKILIIHGTADEIVPFEEVRSFAEKNGISFIPVENADHRFIDPNKMEVVIKSFYEWFSGE